MTEKIFTDGLRIKSQETRFGEILRVGIKSSDFMDFLAKHTNDKGYCNIDIKKGQSGKWFSELNTYKQNSAETADDSVMNFDDMDEEIPY